MTEPNPFEVLEKGYFATLREQYHKARQKYKWSLLPRLVVGTLLFTAGYLVLVIWDGVMWWRNTIAECLGRGGSREHD